MDSAAVALPPGFLERFAEQFEEDTLPQIVSELSKALQPSSARHMLPLHCRGFLIPTGISIKQLLIVLWKA